MAVRKLLNMRVAAMQTHPNVGGHKAALVQLDRTAKQAAGQGADILVTPEMYLTGYNIGQENVREAAATFGGPMLAQVSAIAKKYSIALVVGFPEQGKDGGVFNAAAFWDTQGHLQACYRKTHLYGDVDQAQFSAGGALCSPFEFKGWSIGLAICYDIEFPEVARALAICQWQLKFPQFGQIKIPQFTGVRLSAVFRDLQLHSLVDDHDALARVAV